MGVTLIPVGFLKEYAGGRDRLELAAGPTVAEMLETVGIPPALVAGVVRDGELVSKDYRPQDGDTVKVLAIMGGG
ncbi:MAG: MoaD/ThiS family protein [Anaerolineales bacterium]|nr:MoaD/ThiS family protein [Anaerolineales bacterium]